MYGRDRGTAVMKGKGGDRIECKRGEKPTGGGFKVMDISLTIELTTSACWNLPGAGLASWPKKVVCSWEGGEFDGIPTQMLQGSRNLSVDVGMVEEKGNLGGWKISRN